jgi:peptidoglycan-associated lipoprotein
MPTTAVAPPAPPAPPGAPNAAATPRSLSEDEIFAQKTLAQLNNERPLADVYFDLDNAAIKDEGRAALTTNATYLKRWPSTRINVEGHCDERGTAEYNLALGERRANAVKAYLVELGVPGDRIVIVSKGKESPFCTEKGESCWRQNRRGHFIITAK